MGQQIIQQPDGKLAVFSSVTDTFIVVDATPEELVEWRAEEAAERAREQTRRELEKVLAGDSRAAYYQSAMTWEEAAAKDRKYGGDL
jgi:adenylate kinase